MKRLIIIGLIVVVVVGIVWAGIRLDGKHVEQAQVVQTENATLRVKNERLVNYNRDMKNKNAELAETNAATRAKIARLTQR